MGETFALPKLNVAPENDCWKTTFLLGWPIFRGYVRSQEGMLLAYAVFEGTTKNPRQKSKNK